MTGRLGNVLPWLAVLVIAAGAAAETNWEIQAVDENGLGTHPKVGADPTDPNNRVVIEGIALNAPAELLDTSQMWQIFVQGEGSDRGGTAAWAGAFYQSSFWPEYPEDIQPGDRVRITGFIANHLGKVNINERHSADPSMNFTVEILERGVGMPEPMLIPSIWACNYFDQTRRGGGEFYQARWVRLNDVFVVEGQWANGQHVWVSQGDGVSFPIYLSSQGDFDQFPQPTGPFDVVGIFDQEAGLGTWPPPDPPYTGDYRIWVKSSAGIIPKLADLDYDGDVDLADWDLLVQAVTGPGQPTLNPHADLDADGDCDLRDMAIFCHRFTGPP